MYSGRDPADDGIRLPSRPWHGAPVGKRESPFKNAVLMNGQEAAIGTLLAMLTKETGIANKDDVLEVALSRGMIGVGEHSPKQHPMDTFPLVYMRKPGESYIREKGK